MKKNVASQSIGVQMITAADGTAFTGTVSVLVTIDNGTQTAGGGTAPAHEGNGYHSYSPTQAETNGDHIAFTFTGTGAIPATVQVYTTFPQTGDNYARLGAPAGASVSADVAAVKSDSAAILVDTGTSGVIVATNNDKTGYTASTVSDKTGYSISGTKTTLDALNDIAATDIVSAGAITTLSGSVVNVDLVDTCTTNTDMRGTDGANTTAPDNASIAAILTDTGTTIPAQITALNDISAVQVNAEVVDALTVDTYAEPGAVPAATSSIKDKLNWLFAVSRNKTTQTSSAINIRNDADGANIGTASASDDGTTFTKGKFS